MSTRILSIALVAFGASACGYSGVVVAGSHVVVLRDGFFGAVRTINSCGVNEAGLSGCKEAPDKEMTAGDPNAPSTPAPAAAEAPSPAPAAAETPPPPPAAEDKATKGKAKEKPAKGKKKKK